MRDDAVIGSIIIFALGIFIGFIIGLAAKTKYIEPKAIQTLKYQPKRMVCVEYDANCIIFHGPAKITFLDPNRFK